MRAVKELSTKYNHGKKVWIGSYLCQCFAGKKLDSGESLIPQKGKDE